METLCEIDKSWAPERLAQEGIIQTAMGRKATHAGTAKIFEGQMDRFQLVAGHWVVTKGTCESKRSAISPRPKFEEGPLISNRVGCSTVPVRRQNAPEACGNFHACAFSRFQTPQQLGRARMACLSRHVSREPGQISAASAVASCG